MSAVTAVDYQRLLEAVRRQRGPFCVEDVATRAHLATSRCSSALETLVLRGVLRREAKERKMGKAVYVVVDVDLSP